MRLLLDAAFPAAAEGLSRPGCSVERWTGGDVADRDLVEAADREGFTALAFVGSHALARQEVLALAAEHGLLVVVTTADDPFNAERDLREHLPSIVRQPSRAAIVQVSSRGADWHPLKTAGKRDADKRRS